MLNFHGMPSRNSMVLVRDESERHIEKRVTYVRSVSEPIETPVAMPGGMSLPPIRTQLVKVFFDDGSSRMGCVTL